MSHPHRTNDKNIPVWFNRLFEDLGKILADVQFLVNHLDEPRILTPPGRNPEGDSIHNGHFNLTDKSYIHPIQSV